MTNHRVIRPIVALAIGLALALYAYQCVTDPEPGRQRAREEAVVMSSRAILQSYVAPAGPIDIVDPVSPDSKVGKVYIYPARGGWEVSGHYRRGEGDWWHPYLMVLDGEAGLDSLTVGDDDAGLMRLAAEDPKFSAVPPAAP